MNYELKKDWRIFKKNITVSFLLTTVFFYVDSFSCTLFVCLLLQHGPLANLIENTNSTAY